MPSCFTVTSMCDCSISLVVPCDNQYSTLHTLHRSTTQGFLIVNMIVYVIQFSQSFKTNKHDSKSDGVAKTDTDTHMFKEKLITNHPPQHSPTKTGKMKIAIKTLRCPISIGRFTSTPRRSRRVS